MPERAVRIEYKKLVWQSGFTNKTRSASIQAIISGVWNVRSP